MLYLFSSVGGVCFFFCPSFGSGFCYVGSGDESNDKQRQHERDYSGGDGGGEGREGLSNVLHDIPKNEENEKLIKKQRRREREI